jgi:hypothetical protein
MKKAAFIFILFITSFSLANATDVQTIISIVYKWNELHNAKQIDQFNGIYAPSVLFYGLYKSEKKCIATKRTLLLFQFPSIHLAPLNALLPNG